MSADLLALLDQLDEARAKATPGEWAQHPADGEYVIGDISDGGESYLDVADTYSFGRETALADAACIVAEHNALPKLTAALRQVAAIADVWDGIADMWTESAEHPSAAPGPREMARGEAFDFRERARVLRAALTAALTPEQVQP